MFNDSVFRGSGATAPTDIHDLRPLVHTPGKEYNAARLGPLYPPPPESAMPEPWTTMPKTLRATSSTASPWPMPTPSSRTRIPSLPSLVDEYRRGLMIFNYNDKMIWSKAIYDTVGFADFYARESRTKKSLANPDDSIFFWRTRARVVVFDVADSLCLAPAKARSAMQKALKKNHSSSRDESAPGQGGQQEVHRRPTPSAATSSWWSRPARTCSPTTSGSAVSMPPKGKGYRLLVVQDIIEPCLKGQFEARGYYLNAWQNEVEENLNKELRSKYRVKIN